MIELQNYSCPKCGTRHPDWEKHAAYERDLIGFEKGSVIRHIVRASRFKCSSCDSTHAILPEFIIPFKSHSLFFVLAVMKDLLLAGSTVSRICAKYEISASTLYAWKALFFEHKRIWLGALEDIMTSAEEFLNFLCNEGIRRRLREFFAIANRSLFQNCGDLPRNGRFMPD